ncbi:TIR domain-containing protein [Sulfitobacter pontiacus]|uniref:TIR domain-containing protein n=1 Tax=Sulfitobacter pontiacus TaxID=60137 RepID=UPI0015DD9C32|nr:TIR domain-containing protein [Sulfitobacter pontiacus]QLL42824.1 TIR domain-containing protein [Sulfitobacter pontiacus]
MSDQYCFISYASEDLHIAQTLYRRLREFGLRPWMDKPPRPYHMEGLKPGELWEDRLRDAIGSAKYFIPLFSKKSVEKTGYVQSEFRQALSRLAQIPAGMIFVIPVRIEDCKIPNARIDGISFAQYQYYDCWFGNFFDLTTYLADLEGQPITHGSRTKIDVYTAAEFLDALRPNVEIVIRNGFSLTGVDVPDNQYVFSREVFDGEEIVIQGIDNISISGIGEPEISVSPRYATTLNFERSNGIVISGLSIGHRPDIGECQGAVLNFSDCAAIHVKDCRLFGCGTYGFELVGCDIVSIQDCDVFECSYGFFTCENVTALSLSCVDFYDSICFDVVTAKNSDIKFSGCNITNNRSRADNYKVFNTYRTSLQFIETTIDIGGFDGLGLPSDTEGLNVTGRGAQWPIPNESLTSSLQREPLPSARQREEETNEVLIFVVDESYDRIGEYVNWDDYPDEWSATEAASKVFLDRIKTEFDCEFEEANIGPGADLPAFVTFIASNVVPLIPWLMAIFFSGKPIVDNIEAWRTILSKIRPFFCRTVVLNRNGAAVLAIDAVFEDMGGIPKKVVLLGYKPDYRYNDAELVAPTEIEDPMPTLNLSMVKHVFQIEADGVSFVVAVDGTKVTANRI